PRAETAGVFRDAAGPLKGREFRIVSPELPAPCASLGPRAWGGSLAECPSERLEEGEQREPVESAQVLELEPRGAALSAVAEDGLFDGFRAAVVQEARLGAQAPERLCAHQPAGGAVLGDAVAQAAHVVEEEVREGVVLHLVERRDGVVPGAQGLRVAVQAADRGSDDVAVLGEEVPRATR